MEICGGEGRPSRVAIRTQLTAGENTDLVAGWNASDPAHQEAIVEYICRHRPLLIIMGPSCSPWGHGDTSTQTPIGLPFGRLSHMAYFAPRCAGCNRNQAAISG